MDPLVRRHRSSCIGVLLIGRTSFRALREGEHEHRTESSCEKAKKPGAHLAPARFSDPVTKKIEPVLFVPALRIGERKQNLAFFTGTARSKVAIDGSFRLLVSQILSPAAQVGGGRLPRWWAGWLCGARSDHVGAFRSRRSRKETHP